MWEVMAEQFADIADWSSNVVDSSLDGPLAVGATRTCKLAPTPAGLDQIEELITNFDRGRKTFAFDIVSGLPGMMKGVSSAWKIEAVGPNRTRATNTLTINVKWYMTPMLPVIRSQFVKTIWLLVKEMDQTAARQARHSAPLAMAG
ncbi:MAG: SRPBCC family protein [Rhodobacteraceae bacterium]|nr:SRPBCC family protein [Paracoccaceae bacterium]